MNAVDNYEKIRKLLVFDSKDDFYQIQIIKRRKENPGLKNNAKVVKEYYVSSLEYYDEIRSDVLGITEATRSRAYINLNVRSFKNAAFATMDRILKHMRSEDYFSVRQAYTRSASSRTSRKNMRWIIDFDKDDIDTDTMFCLKKGSFTHELMISGVEILDIVPTPNGLHYIVKPFDRLKFKEAYPNHQSSNIKKNSPTVLFSTVL
mgnify:CR=1 FL=1